MLHYVLDTEAFLSFLDPNAELTVDDLLVGLQDQSRLLRAIEAQLEFLLR